MLHILDGGKVLRFVKLWISISNFIFTHFIKIKNKLDCLARFVDGFNDGSALRFLVVLNETRNLPISAYLD